jgi:hypothetical protein
VATGYQYGSGTGQRLSRISTALCSGGEALYLYPGQRLWADLQSIAGRMRVAEAKGELGSLEISGLYGSALTSPNLLFLRF